jgi:hypothetical protein
MIRFFVCLCFVVVGAVGNQLFNGWVESKRFDALTGHYISLAVIKET